MAKKPLKKPIGYTASDRKSMDSLVKQYTDPYADDVTGGSSVSVVKKKKKMAGGGIVRGAGAATRGKSISKKMG